MYAGSLWAFSASRHPALRAVVPGALPTSEAHLVHAPEGLRRGSAPVDRRPARRAGGGQAHARELWRPPGANRDRAASPLGETKNPGRARAGRASRDRDLDRRRRETASGGSCAPGRDAVAGQVTDRAETAVHALRGSFARNRCSRSARTTSRSATERSSSSAPTITRTISMPARAPAPLGSALDRARDLGLQIYEILLPPARAEFPAERAELVRAQAELLADRGLVYMPGFPHRRTPPPPTPWSRPRARTCAAAPLRSPARRA